MSTEEESVSEIPRDDEAVLFQLVNEEIFQVGFRAFIVQYPLNDEILDDLKNHATCVSLKLPTCELGNANFMKKRLERHKERKFVVAKVIDFGGKFLFIYIINSTFKIYFTFNRYLKT